MHVWQWFAAVTGNEYLDILRGQMVTVKEFPKLSIILRVQ